MSFLKTLKISAALVALSAGGALANDVEVLHWWTSGGEAAALNVLKGDLETQSIGWQDMPVAGGGGEQAMTVLRARVTAGNAPTAVQMLGFDIQDWAAEGALANLNDVAAAEGWDAVVPAALQRFSKYDGAWVAAPVNVHSTNWVWANKAVLDANGIAVPETWDDFVAAVEKLAAAGVTPIAHGGQAWQDATIFDAVVMSTGGPDFYKAAFIDLDPAALGSETMKEAFDRMSFIRANVDSNFSGRDWNLATAMVINGEAAFQIMGDWAKGEFMAAGKVPGEDFLCASTPGDGFLYNVDSFAMFKVEGDDKVAGQELLAKLIVGPSFQEVFNLNKGSIPARTDVALDKFDSCAILSAEDMAASSANGSLLPSYAHGMALRGAQAGAITDVVTAHFNSDMSSEEAVAQLAQAVANSY